MRRRSSRSLLQSFRLVVEISTSNNAPDPSEDFTQEERIFTHALMPDGRCCTTVLKQCAFGPSIIAPNGSGRQFVGKPNAAASTPMPAQWFHPDQTPRQRGSLPPSRPSSDQTLPIIPPSHWKRTGNLYVCCRFRFRATVLRSTECYFLEKKLICLSKCRARLVKRSCRGLHSMTSFGYLCTWCSCLNSEAFGTLYCQGPEFWEP